MGKEIYKKFNKDEVLFTSDVHFSHKNITLFTNRPYNSVEEMNESLIENWNKVVKPTDHIFHLGDLCFCNKSKAIELIKRLNGNIHLILGNHDYRNRVHFFAEQLPNVVQVAFGDIIKVEDREIVVTHYPLLTWAGWDSGVWNLHGHVHSTPENPYVDLRYNQYDVGVDNNNMIPRTYNELEVIMKNKELMWKNNNLNK